MHQPVRIHDSDGNPITATNPLEVDVKTLAAPTSLPLPNGAATQATLLSISADIALMKADLAAIRAILES